MAQHDDDPSVPLQHRHDAEGARYRRWRDHHPGGTWDRYQLERPHAPSLKDLLPREPPSREAQQEGFRREHDTGDLDPKERDLLAIGIAPRLTPRRILQRFGGITGIVLMLFAGVIGVKLSPLAALPLGLVGLALFGYELFRPRPKRKKKG